MRGGQSGNELFASPGGDQDERTLNQIEGNESFLQLLRPTDLEEEASKPAGRSE